MKRIAIWGEDVPFNTGKEKLNDMPLIHEEWTMKDIFEAKDNNIFHPEGVVESMDVVDTMVYLQEMKTGNCSMRYDDIPYLEAYPVKGSKLCVLDVPGGAYLSVSMKNEGKDVAEKLNAMGISVFVLRYRTYPYQNPVMFADCQRAIKWLIGHSDDYGYDPKNISTIGYSAGGNLVASTYHLFMDKDLLPRTYEKDAIDSIQPSIASLGLVYPALNFNVRSKLLAVVVGLDTMKDEEKRKKAIEKFSLTPKVSSDQVPTFLCNATNDDLIPSDDILSYAMALQHEGVPFEMHSYSRGGHGFGGCQESFPGFPADLEGVDSWMEHYGVWLKKVKMGD